MIPAAQKDDRLLLDIQQTAELRDGFQLWWLGQSGFLLQHQGQRLLLDPYLSDSLTTKYAQTDKPHVRMTERVLDPARLTGIHLITSSHNHTDHLDGDTLGPLLRSNPDAAMLVPAANQAFAADRLQIPAERLQAIDAGQTRNLAGFTVHAVPAAHDTIDRDDQGRCRYLGYVIRFDHATIYHSGDTVRYDGMAELLSPWNIDVALLPINGRGPERRVAGNLWGDEAARLAHDIGARLLIPCHYDMFTFNTDTPQQMIDEAQRLGQSYRVLRCGERCDVRGPG